MLVLEKIEQLTQQHKISNKTRDFLIWCTKKFNIEELLENNKKVKFSTLNDLFTAIGMKMSTSAQARRNDLEEIDQYFCKVNRITTRTTELSELKYCELSEFNNGDLHGVYQEIFLLLFNNWLNVKRAQEIIVLPREEIAIEMGILKCYYQLFHGTHEEYSEFVKNIDKEKRLDDLIDTQLYYMQKNSHRQGHFYMVENKVVRYTTETTKEHGESITRQVFESYVEDARLLKIYEEACKIKRFPPECENMTHMWKIIAPKNKEFIPLDDFIQQLIIRILIINKQDKVYRALILKQAEKKKRDFEDVNDLESWNLRHQHYHSEQVLDNETRYEELKTELTPLMGSIDPSRSKVNGSELNKVRQKAHDILENKRDNKMPQPDEINKAVSF